MGTIKDRNGTDLTKVEDTKKRWQEYTEKLYKKDLHDPDNNDEVITNLEPDILESEVVQSCLTLCDPWTVAHQASLSMRFSRQEYWSGLPQNNCTNKDLLDPDNHNGVITHLEPDILECEVKWAYHYEQS